jgi:hypothetical protein
MSKALEAFEKMLAKVLTAGPHTKKTKKRKKNSGK